MKRPRSKGNTNKIGIKSLRISFQRTLRIRIFSSLPFRCIIQSFFLRLILTNLLVCRVCMERTRLLSIFYVAISTLLDGFHCKVLLP